MKRHWVAVSMWLLLSGVGSTKAEAGDIIVVAQERRLEAFASFGGPVEPERLVFQEMGPFEETVQKLLRNTNCIPGKCVDSTVSGTATQDSLIGIVDGAFDVRAHGRAASGTILTSGSAGAMSAISTVFYTDSAVTYALRATLSGAASIVLANVNGEIISHRRYSGHIEENGILPAGLYTLTVDASTRVTNDQGEFNMRFTTAPAGVVLPPDRARCQLDIPNTIYSVGDTVTASEVRIAGAGEAVAVELKMWLRLPSGQVVSARNAGADGTVIIPAGVSKNFGPVPLWTIVDESERGTYEFSCRLLDPLTGDELSRDSAVFLVR